MLTERQKQALQQRLVEDMASRARDRREPATGEPGGEATRPKESAETKTRHEESTQAPAPGHVAAAIARGHIVPDEWAGRLFDGFSSLMESAKARCDIEGVALAKAMRDSFAGLYRTLYPAPAQASAPQVVEPLAVAGAVTEEQYEQAGEWPAEPAGWLRDSYEPPEAAIRAGGNEITATVVQALAQEELHPDDLALRIWYAMRPAIVADTSQASAPVEPIGDRAKAVTRVEFMGADYVRGWDAAVAAGAPQASAPSVQVEPHDHEKFDAIAAARYRVVPNTSGFWGHAVVVGDSTAQVYKGHKRDCELVARRMAGAFLDGAFLASQASAHPAAPNPWRQALDDKLVNVGLDCLGPEEAPQQALKRLIEWEVTTALDPAVSEQAQNLIYRGRVYERCEREPAAPQPAPDHSGEAADMVPASPQPARYNLNHDTAKMEASPTGRWVLWAAQPAAEPVAWLRQYSNAVARDQFDAYTSERSAQIEAAKFGGDVFAVYRTPTPPSPSDAQEQQP